MGQRQRRLLRFLPCKDTRLVQEVCSTAYRTSEVFGEGFLSVSAFEHGEPALAITMTMTMRTVCGKCGRTKHVKRFRSMQIWPECCGAAMLSPVSSEVRAGDALVAMAREMARALER